MKITLYFTLLFAVSLFGSVNAKQPSYLTNQNCNYEEECMLEAFKDIVMGQDGVVRKWDMSKDDDGKFNILVLGDDYEAEDKNVPSCEIDGVKYTHRYRCYIYEITEQIKPYVPFEVEFLKGKKGNVNSVFIFSDDFDRDAKKYKKLIIKLHKNEDFFNNFMKFNPKSCYNSLAFEPNRDFLILSTSFISDAQSKESFKSCALGQVFQHYGMQRATREGSYARYVAGIVLLDILYDSSIKSGMAYKELQKVFSEAYQRSIKKF